MNLLPSVLFGFGLGPRSLRMLAKIFEATRNDARFYGIAWGRFGLGLVVKVATKGDGADAEGAS